MNDFFLNERVFFLNERRRLLLVAVVVSIAAVSFCAHVFLPPPVVDRRRAARTRVDACGRSRARGIHEYLRGNFSGFLCSGPRGKACRASAAGLAACLVQLVQLLFWFSWFSCLAGIAGSDVFFLQLVCWFGCLSGFVSLAGSDVFIYVFCDLPNYVGFDNIILTLVNVTWYNETDDRPNPRPTQSKKIRLKVKSGILGHFFPQLILFHGLGLVLYSNRLQGTQPNQTLRKTPYLFFSANSPPFTNSPPIYTSSGFNWFKCPSCLICLRLIIASNNPTPISCTVVCPPTQWGAVVNGG